MPTLPLNIYLIFVRNTKFQTQRIKKIISFLILQFPLIISATLTITQGGNILFNTQSHSSPFFQLYSRPKIETHKVQSCIALFSSTDFCPKIQTHKVAPFFILTTSSEGENSQ